MDSHWRYTTTYPPTLPHNHFAPHGTTSLLHLGHLHRQKKVKKWMSLRCFGGCFFFAKGWCLCLETPPMCFGSRPSKKNAKKNPPTAWCYDTLSAGGFFQMARHQHQMVSFEAVIQLDQKRCCEEPPAKAWETRKLNQDQIAGYRAHQLTNEKETHFGIYIYIVTTT